MFGGGPEQPLDVDGRRGVNLEVGDGGRLDSGGDVPVGELPVQGPLQRCVDEGVVVADVPGARPDRSKAV